MIVSDGLGGMCKETVCHISMYSSGIVLDSLRKSSKFHSQKDGCLDSESCLGPTENQGRMCGYGNTGAIKIWGPLSVTNLGDYFYFAVIISCNN
jgi:hypothetical protein